VATFANVERSTHHAYLNLRAQSEVEIRYEQKKPQDSGEPCGLSLRIIFRSIFDNYPLHHALLAGASVIHSHFLAGPERRSHNFADSVNNARGRAEREGDRAFMTFDDDSFPGLVSSYGAS
jgi:hypothetical protein